MPETDESLMQAVVAGDLERLGCLFDRCHVGVHALCARLVGSADAADDLLQEVFLRVLRFRHSYRAEASFRTWLFRITYNVCMTYRRKERATFDVASSLAASDQMTHASYDADVRSAVERALEALPAAARTVLILNRYHGLSYAEIAEVIGSTPGAVRVQAHRALRTLRKRWRNCDVS
jgi:RNA polymerase sigma-70 factor (ECF subfamily)